MHHATLGILARVDVDLRAQVQKDLANLKGVDTFDVEDELQLGILVEAPDLDAARDVLTQQISSMPGVLGAWPIFADFGGCSSESEVGDGTKFKWSSTNMDGLDQSAESPVKPDVLRNIMHRREANDDGACSSSSSSARAGGDETGNAKE